MTDLVTWFRAHLDEEEREAVRAGGRRWQSTKGEYGPEVRVDLDDSGRQWKRDVNHQVWTCDDELDGCPDSARAWMAEARHIARWDPARVLAEVEAKRRLLNAYDEAKTWYDANPSAPAGEVHGLLTAIKHLALPCADRPGYDESWRP